MNNLPLIIIFSYAFLNGILLTVMLLFNRKHYTRSNTILAVLIFCLSMIIFEAFLEVSGLFRTFPHLIYSFSGAFYLVPPLLYFYFKLLIQPDYQFKLWDAVHCLPALLMIFELYEFYTFDPEFKIAYIESHMSQTDQFTALNHQIIIIIYNILFIGYLYHSISLLRQFIQSFKASASSTTIEYVILLKHMSYFISVYLILSLSTMISLFVFNDYYFINRYTNSIALSVFIQFLLITIIRYPDRFVPKIDNSGEKYKTSKLESSELISIQSQLESLMKTQRPYLNPHLKISDIAEQIGINSHLISQVINSGYHLNFYDFINQYRIEAAKERLNQNDHLTYSLQAIAEECGFNNYVSFYRVFKKMVNQTPSEFVNS
jgi:AraC-like DNA-binding protein